MNQLLLKLKLFSLSTMLVIHSCNAGDLQVSSMSTPTATQAVKNSNQWETINQARVVQHSARIAALEVKLGHIRKVVILTTLAGTGILSYYAWNAWQRDSLAIKTSPEKLHEIFDTLPEAKKTAIIKAGASTMIRTHVGNSSFIGDCLDTVKTIAKPLISGILIKTVSNTLTNVLLKPIEPAILSVRKLLQINVQPCFNESTALQFITQSTRISTLIASLKRSILAFDNDTTYIQELYNNIVYQTESLFGYMHHKLSTFDTQLYGYTQQAGLLQIDSIADHLKILHQKLVNLHDQNDLTTIVAACCNFENEVTIKAKEFSELYQPQTQS